MLSTKNLGIGWPVAALLLLLTVSRGAIAGTPVPIPIANAGFEADTVSAGCFQVLAVTDWTVFDPNGIQSGGNVVGGLNLPVGSVWFPDGAPEGDHAALVFLQDSIGAGPMGLTQVLSDALQPNTRYTLQVEVGDIASGTGPPPCDVFGFFNLNGFPGYQVQLLAGGEVIAEDDNTLAGVLDDGEFSTSTVQACIDASHAQLGELLEIRLINLNEAEAPGNPGIEVDFDDVRLTAEPIAHPPPGDLDYDCDIDGTDYALFQSCLGGPAVPPAGSCAPGIDADFDDDGDVDLNDFAVFSDQFMST